MRGLEQIGQVQSQARNSDQGIRLTTFIPVKFVRHKARKVMIEPATPGRHATLVHPGQSAYVDENLMSALVRALFWQDLLDAGKVASISELATVEGLDKVRLQKMLKLARLAPDLVEAIASGCQPAGLTLEYFLRHPLPGDWETQRRMIAGLGPG